MSRTIEISALNEILNGFYVMNPVVVNGIRKQIELYFSEEVKKERDYYMSLIEETQKLKRSRQMRNYNEPPEPIECNPENYNFHDCYFCVNREDCKKEYEENEPTNFERCDKGSKGTD